MELMEQQILENMKIVEGGEPASSSGIYRAVPGDMFPTTEEGLAILTNAIAEIADSGVARESADNAWLEEDTETPEERFKMNNARYLTLMNG